MKTYGNVQADYHKHNAYISLEKLVHSPIKDIAVSTYVDGSTIRVKINYILFESGEIVYVEPCIMRPDETDFSNAVAIMDDDEVLPSNKTLENIHITNPTYRRNYGL